MKGIHLGVPRALVEASAALAGPLTAGSLVSLREATRHAKTCAEKMGLLSKPQDEAPMTRTQKLQVLNWLVRAINAGRIGEATTTCCSLWKLDPTASRVGQGHAGAEIIRLLRAKNQTKALDVIDKLRTAILQAEGDDSTDSARL